jgi:hypothetical protein
LTAAATIALSGLFISAPAFAEDGAELPADPSVTTSETAAPEAPAETAAPEAPAETEALKAPEETEAPTAPAPEVLKAVDDAAENGVEVLAVGENAAGKDVVVVTEASADEVEAIDEFAEDANLDDPKVVTAARTLEKFAEGDVVGGQGYISVRESDGKAWACSVGFSAYAPDGAAALLSAGHCAFDDNDDKLSATTLTIPNQEPAVGGTGGAPADPDLLGRFGFAQFGGTNSSAGSNGDTNATDISIIDLEAGFNPLPAVTDWKSAGASLYSLADSTIAVTAVGAPTVGAVSKSGRTTGFTTGAIDGNDVLDGWANISGHWVRGFSSNTLADRGDSGGSVIQGTTAVGVISGGSPADPVKGTEQFTWATSLVHALEKTGGYEVALDLVEPVITTPADGADVTPGQNVSGTAPGATSVIVNVGAGDQTVPVSNGAFSFAGPVALGAGSISVTSAYGFSRSDTTTIAVNVKAAPLVAPVITSPANGSTVTATVTEVSGTGLPTADITVTNLAGETLGTAVVGVTGSWTVTGLNLAYGDHTVIVTQASAGETSPEARSRFIVAPVAPGVTSIANGASFPHDGGPAVLSGTGIDGATVTVVLDGVDVMSAPASAEIGALAAAVDGIYTATVAGGTWSVSFPAALTTGAYTVSATQRVSGVSSAATSIGFAVLAVPTAPGGGGGAGGGGAVAPGGNGDGNLAETGADAVLPLTASAIALALLSGGLLLVVARRRRALEV